RRGFDWLDPRRGGLLAGELAGLVVLYGIAAGFLASRGKAKGFVVVSTILVTALSCAALGWGVAALVVSTSRGAWISTAMVGAMGIALCAVMSKLIKRKYAAVANISGT